MENIIDILDTLPGQIDIANLSNNLVEGIDFAARLRLAIKGLQDVEKELTKELTLDANLDGETGQGREGDVQGIYWTAHVTETIRWTFDSKGARAEFGDAWYDSRCKQSVVRSVKYNAA